MQRSSSADRRRPTPPPATVRELRSTLQRSSSSQSNVTSALDFSAAGSRPVSPQPRASSASRASSPSREHYQHLVRATYFGYESNYPNELDVQRKQQTAGLRPPRLTEKPLPPKFTHYRGHQRCKHCSTLVPIPSMAEHASECSLAPVACPLVDSETGAPCGVVCRGRELLHEHLLTCGARTKHCDNRGCGKLVSVQSIAIHLQKCSFERVRCLHCHVLFPRCEAAVHMDICPQEQVSCPLGCGASLRRGDVQAHMHNQLWIHKASLPDPTKVAPEAPGSVVQFLLQRLVEMHEASLKRRAGAPSQIPSLNGSRCITPTFSQARGAVDAKNPVGSISAAGLPVSSAKLLSDDAPSSIQENPVEDDLSVIGDAEVEGLKPPPPLHPSPQTEAPALAGERSASSSSSPAKPLRATGSGSAFRDRSDFHQPIQSVAFQQLFEHIMTELKWTQRELSSMVEGARVKHFNDESGLSAEKSGAVAAGSVDHRWESPNLPQEVSDRLQYLRQMVDALVSRNNFEGLPKQTGEMKQEEAEREWKKLDRIWYEWKLVLYERMYLSP